MTNRFGEFTVNWFAAGEMHSQEFTKRSAANARFKELEAAMTVDADTVQLFGWFADTGEPRLIAESWYESEPAPRRVRSRNLNKII